MASDATPRRIDLNRGVARIWPDRIEIKPSRGAAVVPAIGLALGILAVVVIVTQSGQIPFALSVLLLLVALLAIPLAGVGFVYAAFGADTVIDRHKQSVVRQQGFLGMGVGTEELVPFWKIERIEVADTIGEGEPGDAQGIAQYEVVLHKTNGKTLTVGIVTAHAAMAEDARARATELASAIAGLTVAPLTTAKRAEVPADDARERPPAGKARR